MPEPPPDPVPAQPEPEPAAAQPTPDPATPDPATAQPEPEPAAAQPEPKPAEPATKVVAPKWTGSAAVPPLQKKRRWLGSATDDLPAPPPPRDPTLELPPAEREALESGVPVDPWAEAAADPWAAHREPHPHVPALPPNRPYPAPPASPPPVFPQPVPPRPVPPLVYQPPPGWRPPPGYVPVAVRRRRRWPWVLLVLTLLTFGCCCACPGYFLQPMSEQYPATAALPAKVADLSLRDDAEGRQAAQRLEQEMRADHLLAEDIFAGVYTASDGNRVTIVGTTGFRLSPDKDIDAEMTRLAGDYQLTDVRAVNTGIRGEYQQCGIGKADGTDVVLCTWTDYGSLGTALFTGRSIAESVELLNQLRTTIVARG